MQIREPKYKPGDKVDCITLKAFDFNTGFEKEINKCEIESVKSYDFEQDEYYYNTKEWVGHAVCECTLKTHKPNTVWDLKNGDECYFLASDGDVLDWAWDDNPLKIRRRELGDLFLSKEEAEFDVERRRIETKMLKLGGRRTLKKGEDNWLIYYNDGLKATALNESIFQGAIYFDLEDEAYNAIKKIGEGRLEKYIFGVNK